MRQTVNKSPQCHWSSRGVSSTCRGWRGLWFSSAQHRTDLVQGTGCNYRGI